ncbi:MAG TPA: EamA family transporter [Polyangiaceae bacterium]|nr:EamA family transporter [Polyangiaceae bacterium]
MHWAPLSLTSALFLGFYDTCQKHALRDNPVLPVLLISTGTCAAVWSTLLVAQRFCPTLLPSSLLVPELSWLGHAELLFKAVIVAASWLCTYLAVKHLPISLAAPIRATSPLWTLAAAILLLAERPSWLQVLGIATTLLSFLGLSLVGRLEGVHFHRDRWVGFMILGTLFGAASGLYDKLLLGKLALAPATVQAWFSIYLLALFAPAAGLWWLARGRRITSARFEFRFSMVVLALCLLCADFAYFSALRQQAGLISLVASVRRGSTLIAFAAGVFVFKESNGWKKLPPVLGIVLGIVLTILG